MSGELALPVHGGDLDAIGRRYGIDPATLLDFSANLNPLGPPRALLDELSAAAIDVADLARYPDPDGRPLREALARHLTIDPETIVVGNGAAALFSAAFAALGTRRCVVPTPAFSEYAHAIRNAGATMHALALDRNADFALDPAALTAAIEDANADTSLITNPHNPTGALLEREAVLAISRRARTRAVAMIVDEAFVDYAPEASLVRDAATGDGSLVVVRSLTKFYAVPALRVGYAVTSPERAVRMRAALPSWPVTSLASRALACALDDADYARSTLATNERARARLFADLECIGLRPFRSAANFLFVELPTHAPRAPDLRRQLVLEAGIVVRDCSSYAGCETGSYVRVAVRSEADNERLIDALVRAVGGLHSRVPASPVVSSSGRSHASWVAPETR